MALLSIPVHASGCVGFEAAQLQQPTFAFIADVTEAHRQVLVHPTHWRFLGCQVKQGETVYVNAVRTFGTSSASHHWSRISADLTVPGRAYVGDLAHAGRRRLSLGSRRPEPPFRAHVYCHRVCCCRAPTTTEQDDQERDSDMGRVRAASPRQLGIPQRRRRTWQPPALPGKLWRRSWAESCTLRVLWSVRGLARTALALEGGSYRDSTGRTGRLALGI